MPSHITYGQAARAGLDLAGVKTGTAELSLNPLVKFWVPFDEGQAATSFKEVMSGNSYSGSYNNTYVLTATPTTPIFTSGNEFYYRAAIVVGFVDAAGVPVTPSCFGSTDNSGFQPLIPYIGQDGGHRDILIFNGFSEDMRLDADLLCEAVDDNQSLYHAYFYEQTLDGIRVGVILENGEAAYIESERAPNHTLAGLTFNGGAFAATTGILHSILLIESALEPDRKIIEKGIVDWLASVRESRDAPGTQRLPALWMDLEAV